MDLLTFSLVALGAAARNLVRQLAHNATSILLSSFGQSGPSIENNFSLYHSCHEK